MTREEIEALQKRTKTEAVLYRSQTVPVDRLIALCDMALRTVEAERLKELAIETATAINRLADENYKHACAAEARLSALEEEIGYVVNAKRFYRKHFDDDTAFVDWAQSRLRSALSGQPSAVERDAGVVERRAKELVQWWDAQEENSLWPIGLEARIEYIRAALAHEGKTGRWANLLPKTESDAEIRESVRALNKQVDEELAAQLGLPAAGELRGSATERAGKP